MRSCSTYANRTLRSVPVLQSDALGRGCELTDEVDDSEHLRACPFFLPEEEDGFYARGIGLRPGMSWSGAEPLRRVCRERHSILKCLWSVTGTPRGERILFLSGLLRLNPVSTPPLGDAILTQ